MFADCFSLEAAEQVSRSNLPISEYSNFLDLLLQLVNKSLINVEIEVPATGSETRYQMQETIRPCRACKLLIAGETAAVHTVYCDYYLWFVKQAEPKLYDQEQNTWSDKLEAEYDNLRAAIEWSLGNMDSESVAQLVMHLIRFWQLRGYYCEAAMWLDRTLTLPGIPDQTQAELLLARGLSWRHKGSMNKV